ncbi:fumarylacetoacetate hydrolase family protein [Alcaligenaceae bacterium]|nr:fumarylacetoacetate hydrolase family protein [Alcaligenaceae bacterium]
MKLIRYGEVGEERPGILDDGNQIRSLYPVIKDIDVNLLVPEALRFLEAIDPEKLPVVDGQQRIGSPVQQFRQIIAIGLNYRNHAKESGLPVPTEPVVFHKSISSIVGPNDDIALPADALKTDWEVELGIVIGTSASRIEASQARKHIAGYCLVNDVSERHWQVDRGGQWGKGKSLDSFTPVGPWLVTTSELSDPKVLDLTLDLNGVRKQHGNTSDMVFDVDTIVSYLSQFMTLHPGDLIITGTPAGVGMGRNPPEYLKAGDRIDMFGTGLGKQSHTVKAL